MSYKVNPRIAERVEQLVSFLPESKKVVTLLGSGDGLPEKAVQADLKELFDAKAKDRKGNPLVIQVKTASTSKSDKK